MAFVCQSTRKINQISKTTCPLGPGQYFKAEKQEQKRDCAPFQSTNRRISFLQVSDKNVMPGPGNYEVSRPFVEPNIKTVSNSQSIIVKINSTGTAQFKSVVDRFDSRDHQFPGPGKYEYSLKKSPRSHSHDRPTVHDDNIIEKLKNLSSKKNYPAIPQRTRGLTDAKKQEVNPEGKLGPAYYNPSKRSYLNCTSTAWGKDKSNRFSLDAKSEVGPGKYNSLYNPIKADDKINQPSGHFKSSTVRTYFDSLFYKTNLAETANARDKTKYKSKQPAPGQYQTNYSSIKASQKPFALQFFGSTVERFPEGDSELDTPSNNKRHKSFYNIRSEIGQTRSFNKSQHAFLSDTLRKPSFLQVNQKQKNPGPGQYRQRVKVEKKLKGNNLQKFGTNTKRIFQEEDKGEGIGPGQYFDEEKKKQQDAVRNSRFGQITNIGCNFKSSTNRDCFGQSNQQKHPFAQYQVSHYDLSKKIEKQKNFIENLKKIDVQRAPFESSISRFPHYQKKKENNQFSNNAQQSKKQQLKLKEQGEKIRQLVLQANHSQVSQVQKHHFGKTSRFQSEKKNAPAVGSYSVKSNWQKRSHNVKYNSSNNK